MFSLFSSCPFSLSFSLASCHYIFFGFLLLSRSPSSIDPGQSFFLVPLPSSFFSLISVPRSVHCSLRFLLGFLSCYVHKKYMHSGFVPFSFRPRSGPVSFSFPFVPAAFLSRPRLLFVPVASPFRFLFVPAAFQNRLLFVSLWFRRRSGPVSFSFPFSSEFVPF
jgi:hypothetical protein